jgi:hypothetical protein
VKREILFAEVFDKLEAYGDIKGILEFGSERIPRSLLRGKRANAELLFLKNRRFSAACCGELQMRFFYMRIFRIACKYLPL